MIENKDITNCENFGLGCMDCENFKKCSSMFDLDSYLKNRMIELRKGTLETLKQLTKLTFDGDLMSKSERDFLLKKGLIIRINGYNIVNEKGIETLYNLGILKYS